MLSDNEKRLLRQIEQELEQEAPGFADELRNQRSTPPLLDQGWPYVAVTLFGVLLFALGWLAGSILLLLSGVACGALLLVRRTRRRTRAADQNDE